MTNEQLWQAALGELELYISKANFTTWFKNTSIVSKNDQEITIGVSNGFTKEWLENKYHKLILKAVQNVCSEIRKINYKIGGVQKATTNGDFIKPIAVSDNFRNYHNNTEGDNGSDLSFLNPKYTFESFIIGPSNELAHAACSAVSKNIGNVYNPLFIYGGVGLGKTHLLQSIGNEILKKQPNKKVRYASSEKFTSELIEAISGKRTRFFKEIYRKIDVLIIDDIQFLAGKEKTQEEFFHTFNALYENNKQIVLSSDRPPKAIPALEERLKSRFEGGMIADIGFPDYEIRFAILMAKAKAKKLDIPDDSLKYIAQNIQKNIRELEGALNRVVATCELDNSYPDVKKTASILANTISQPIKKATTPKNILENVARFYGITTKDLTQKNRRREVVRPRQIAMYLMRTEIRSSFPSIGDWLGGRDHTTAMHAHKKISQEIENDRTTEQEVRLIIEKLYNN